LKKNILIVGTGTIGEPLIGLLADFRRKLNIGHVIFHKRTPLLDEVAKVNSLIKRGARLAVNEDLIPAFKDLGHDVKYDFQTALKAAHVVIDCTPAGNEHKKKHYVKYPGKIFIAQGSEKDFGVPYAYGINDEVLDKKPAFIQVVSCNTHNIASIINSIDPSVSNIERGDFVCIRRANDISQEGGFIPSPQVGAHNSEKFGTHHAKDAYDLFRTKDKFVNIFSSALKVNSQYMHIIRFNMVAYGHISKENLINRFRENKFVALTHKEATNRVFSFGRDHGYYGRIFNQTVVSIPTLMADSLPGKTKISGFCFTPQDGNSLLSSVAAALYGIYEEEYLSKMKLFDDFLFSEI
jgi:glyceraldehyde-3-phosphate dehydrogenase (NAD(P))